MFFREIGFKLANVLDLDETRSMNTTSMAKVHWLMVFEKDAGHPLEFRFFITYFLFDSLDGLKVVFYISHDDEQKVMREAGLLPAEQVSGS